MRPMPPKEIKSEADLTHYVSQMSNNQLGFEGLVAKGYTKFKAWLIILKRTRDDPEAMAILRGLYKNNPAAVEEQRKDWAKYGLKAPIDVLLKDEQEK